MSKQQSENLKVIEGGNPYFLQSLSELLVLQQDGRIRGMAVVWLEEDNVYTDWVKSDKTGLAELLGCVSVLQQEILDRMRA